ncbi:MAG: gamma-glutamyltransferase [Actinomycetota bacterium]|nr:gamma-glutamyltransferase [Actinomycetota bacterium]
MPSVPAATAPSTETVVAPAGKGLVCSIDRLASDAGVELLRAGGNAVDAAIATSAALAVTTPHMCGMGGDLFALVHDTNGSPAALNASGRAGSGADPDRLRGEGHHEMPFRDDVRSAPVPGCVDGWVALHERFGRRHLADVLAPARALATEGFLASPFLAFMTPALDGVEGCDELVGRHFAPDERIVRPGVARMLAAVASGGRAAFYQGEFGKRLLEAGHGEYTPADLVEPNADWVQPLGLRVWGNDVWTIPPNSQGYLSLAAAGIAERVGGGRLPDQDDPAWPHLLIEAARLAGADRDAVLSDRADGASLIGKDRLDAAVAAFRADGVADLGARQRDGGTIYLCAVDGEGCGVSLIQSNASGFGCHVAVPGTGILLHNRGIGFSLVPGHPAEYGPGRRPPHTLSPALVTRGDGSLRAVLGTMGGDSQPQIVLQMLARLLVGAEEPGAVVGAPRWVLSSPGNRGFDTWKDPAAHVVRIEAHSPTGWAEGLEARGHRVEVAGPDPAGFGHAHCIERAPDGTRRGAADPRAIIGAALAS